MENKKFPLFDIMVNKGILHEVNRTFLNPLGLMLNFDRDLTGLFIMNWERYPEKALLSKVEREKINAFRIFSQSQYEKRQDSLGFTIQTKDYQEVAREEKKEKSYSEKRIDVLLKYLDMFYYELRSKLLAKHKECDTIPTTFPAPNVIEESLYYNVIDRDAVDVAILSMFSAYYAEISEEINSLVDEEIKNGKTKVATEE